MAAGSGQFYDESFVCGSSASLVTNQFCLVALTTATTSQGRPGIILATGTSFGPAGAFGVLQDTPAVSRAGIVRMFGLGISKVVASSTASIALGAPVTCSTAGTAMTADTTGQRVFGTALTASTGVLGQTIDVLLNGPFSFTL